MNYAYLKYNSPYKNSAVYYRIGGGKVISINEKFGINGLKTTPSFYADKVEVITKEEFEQAYNQHLNKISI